MKRTIIITIIVLVFTLADTMAQRRSSSSNSNSRSSSKEQSSSGRSSSSSSRSSSESKSYSGGSSSRSSSAREQKSTPARQSSTVNRSSSSRSSSYENKSSGRTSNSNSGHKSSPSYNSNTQRSSAPSSSRSTSRDVKSAPSNSRSSGSYSNNNHSNTSSSPRVRSNSGSGSSSRSGSSARTAPNINRGSYPRGNSTNSKEYHTDYGKRSANPQPREYHANGNGGHNKNVTVVHHKYVSTRHYVDHHHVTHYYVHPPRPRAYRAIHRPFRVPFHVDVYWTPSYFRAYCDIYPVMLSWRYDRAYRVYDISAYDAYRNIGEFRRVYGKVYDTFYSSETDEYFLYVGEYYPYQDFTIVVPGWIARGYSPDPAWYFRKEHVAVTGLISVWNDKPEMVIGRRDQLRVY